MAHAITVPRLGWSMEEGTFVRWLKRDGDTVRRGEPLFELEGDKAIQEVEAVDDGTLRIPPDAPQAGNDVVVGAILGYLVAEGEPLPSRTEMTDRDSTAGSESSPYAIEDKSDNERSSRVDSENSSLTAEARLSISPRAKRVAKELGIDWTRIAGTGAGGRIRERDVLLASTVILSEAQRREESGM